MLLNFFHLFYFTSLYFTESKTLHIVLKTSIIKYILTSISGFV